MIARDILKKTYLAWVAGTCCWRGSRLFEDGIVKVEDARGVERMALVPLASANKKASLTAECLQRREEASLLRLTLHTGRTHQIRAQLSGRGHPIIGDRKYGGPSCDQGLLLHAAHLSFAPALAEALRLPEREIFCPAPWLEPWNVD